MIWIAIGKKEQQEIVCSANSANAKTIPSCQAKLDLAFTAEEKADNTKLQATVLNVDGDCGCSRRPLRYLILFAIQNYKVQADT